MTNRSSRGSEQPEKAVALQRSINDRDLIRELHQGQRSCGRIPRPNTWLHPTKASKHKNPLATQAPSTQAFREIVPYATPEALRKFSWASSGSTSG